MKDDPGGAVSSTESVVGKDKAQLQRRPTNQGVTQQ